MTFALDLRKFAEKAGKRADEVVAQTTAQIVREVDLRSPVRSGRFRGNWQFGIGSMPKGVVNKLDPDGTGTVSANIAEIPEQAAGKVYFLANNLPYAQRLEHGYSKQAPAGMVGITVANFQKIVDEAVASAKAATP